MQRRVKEGLKVGGSSCESADRAGFERSCKTRSGWDYRMVWLGVVEQLGLEGILKIIELQPPAASRAVSHWIRLPRVPSNLQGHLFSIPSIHQDTQS